MKYAYRNAHLLDGTRDMLPRDGLAVLTDGETIVGIVPEEAIPEGFEPVDLGGKYLMPGLINLHVHLAGNGKPQKKQRDNEKLVRRLMGTGLSRAAAYRVVAGFARLEVMSGVTTIRTVGGLGDFDTRLRDEIAAGKRPGPRILAANEGISVPGGHMAGSVAVAAEDIPQALRQVDRAREQGVDLIKLMITGGVMDAKAKGVPGELKMPPEMVKAVCDWAHSLGYPVAAHVESTEGVRVALENGVDSIEHGAKLDEHLIRLFRDRGACLCTTLSPALPYAMFDRSVTGASETEQYNGKLVMDGIIDCAKACLARGIPVALDPVGAGATSLRTNAARELAAEAASGGNLVIRGNASEITCLAAHKSGQDFGVDSRIGAADPDLAASLARHLGTTVAITGAVDVIADGQRTAEVHNGCPMLTYVTGTGCMTTSLIASFAAVTDPFTAAAAGVLAMGIGGELALERGGQAGPGTFHARLFDTFYALNDTLLQQYGKVLINRE